MRDYGKITSPIEFDDLETAQWIQELTADHPATMSKKDRLWDAGLRIDTLEAMTADFEKALSYAHWLHLLDDTLMQELAERDSSRMSRSNVTRYSSIFSAPRFVL